MASLLSTLAKAVSGGEVKSRVKRSAQWFQDKLKGLKGEAKNRFSQDWLSWIKSGIVDMVFPMNYYKEMEYFNRDLKLMLKRIL